MIATGLLTHWGRVTHICAGKLTSIGSDNGLSPSRRQAIIRTNAGILLIGTLGTNFSEILSEIHTFSFKKMHLKMSSGRWQPFCLGLNVLMLYSSIVLVWYCYMVITLSLDDLAPLHTSTFASTVLMNSLQFHRGIWLSWMENHRIFQRYSLLVECCYNAVQYKMTLHSLLQWLTQGINPNLNPWNTSHTLPWRVFCEELGENWPCYNGTALHCAEVHHRLSRSTTEYQNYRKSDQECMIIM